MFKHNQPYVLEVKMIEELSRIQDYLRYLGWTSASKHLLEALDHMSDCIDVPIPETTLHNDLVNTLKKYCALLNHLGWTEATTEIEQACDEIMKISGITMEIDDQDTKNISTSKVA